MRLPSAVPGAAMPRKARDNNLRKVDRAGRPIRQIELCDRHAETVIARERDRAMEILDRRDWR